MKFQASERRVRRSPRLLWRTPVFVIWEPQAGLKVREPSETEVVNAHGALLRLMTKLPLGESLHLLNPQSQESVAARVVWRDKESGSDLRAGVELEAPSQTFWGIYVPVQGRDPGPSGR